MSQDQPLVRYKKFIHGVRLGGAETYRIVAETNEWVIICSWAADGRKISESAFKKGEFEQAFELVAEIEYEVEKSRRGWRVMRRTHGQNGSVGVEVTTYDAEAPARFVADTLNTYIHREVA